MTHLGFFLNLITKKNARQQNRLARIHQPFLRGAAFERFQRRVLPHLFGEAARCLGIMRCMGENAVPAQALLFSVVDPGIG
jgi:hypothetical protein